MSLCVGVCLLFLLKYLSFVGMTPPRRLCAEEDPAAMIHTLLPATPCTLLSSHVSATHFLQMQKVVCVFVFVCVRSTYVSVATKCLFMRGFIPIGISLDTDSRDLMAN